MANSPLSRARLPIAIFTSALSKSGCTSAALPSTATDCSHPLPNAQNGNLFVVLHTLKLTSKMLPYEPLG